jgi:hypothetical protein
MERIITKPIDISNSLMGVQRDLRSIRKSHLNNMFVTKESWEASPTARIAYHKSKIPELKAAGMMKDTKDFEYGWHFPNEYYAKMGKQMTAADRLIDGIIDFLNDCYIKPHRFRFSELELSRFEVIEGGGVCNSGLVQILRGGAL